MPRDFEAITVGDIVTAGTRAVFRVAEIYNDGKMARLEFTSGHPACNASVRGLRLATVQQVQDRHVMSAPSPREAAELMHDGVIPHRVRAALRRSA